MALYVMLNNVAHKEMRVITRYSAEFGDNVATAMVVPTEFVHVQREYPIFFRRDTGTFACLYSCSASQVEQRRTRSPRTMVTDQGFVRCP